MQAPEKLETKELNVPFRFLTSLHNRIVVGVLTSAEWNNTRDYHSVTRRTALSRRVCHRPAPWSRKTITKQEGNTCTRKSTSRA
jgi:hypothetical protein